MTAFPHHGNSRSLLRCPHRSKDSDNPWSLSDERSRATRPGLGPRMGPFPICEHVQGLRRETLSWPSPSLLVASSGGRCTLGGPFAPPLRRSEGSCLGIRNEAGMGVAAVLAESVGPEPHFARIPAGGVELQNRTSSKESTCDWSRAHLPKRVSRRRRFAEATRDLRHPNRSRISSQSDAARFCCAGFPGVGLGRKATGSPVLTPDHPVTSHAR
jgi:hypothetical protein